MSNCMGLSIFLSTGITVLIFIPVTIFSIKYIKIENNIFKNFIVGGSAWSIFALIYVLPYSLLFTQSTISNYIAIMDETNTYGSIDKRTVAFWIILVSCLLSEVVRWKTVSDKKLLQHDYRGTVLHGLGWSVGEFITRYLFFFDENIEEVVLYSTIFFFLIFASNAGLATIMLRAEENTKYVMFAVFLKFFIEIVIFGAFANIDNSVVESLTRIGVVIALQVVLVYMSMLNRQKNISTAATQLNTN